MCKYNFLSVCLAIITVNDYHYYIKASRMIDENGVETILALENENVNMECETDVPMRYCGFMHPNGKQYPWRTDPSEPTLLLPDNVVWYGVRSNNLVCLVEGYGRIYPLACEAWLHLAAAFNTLNSNPLWTTLEFTGSTTYNGKCSIKIKAMSKDTGTWRCSIGNRSVGVETMKVIQLRVVGQFAAVESNITVMHGESYTLYCTTTKGFIPLSYCQFKPPNALPFNIDSSVTESNPLLKRYYFPSNKSLDRGDCAVTISNANYDDYGTWTCGAGLEDGHEYIDVIHFKVKGLDSKPDSTSDVVTLGLITLTAILSILICVARKNRHCLFGSGRSREENIETHELEQMQTEGTPSRTPSTSQVERSNRSVVIETASESSEASAPGTITSLASPEDSEVR